MGTGINKNLIESESHLTYSEVEASKRSFSNQMYIYGALDLDSKYSETKDFNSGFYPSSYRQNVLVMLAKKLITEEEKFNACNHYLKFSFQRKKFEID